MPFRLRDDAKKWFKSVRDDGMPIDFDIYYFCLMAGLAAGQKKDIPTSGVTDIVQYFPERYQSRGKNMVALFLARELRALGIEMKEKKTVHNAIARLISRESQIYLNEDGLKEFNRYAHAGFEVLAEWFEDRPRKLQTFLRIYNSKFEELARQET